MEYQWVWFFGLANSLIEASQSHDSKVTFTINLGVHYSYGTQSQRGLSRGSAVARA